MPNTQDPYLYPGTNVHINVAGIKDKARLKEYTAKQFAVSMIRLQKEPIILTSCKDLLLLHRILFRNVFEWAGKIRVINVTQSEFILGENTIVYSDYTMVMKELEQVDEQFMKLPWETFSKEMFIDTLSNMIVTLWVIRPFREGNTRTLMVFIDLFIQKYGYEINLSEFNKHSSDIRNALVWATIGEFYNLNLIFNDIISHKRVTKNQ
ncbi:MAG TPA: Fic family protein [Acholeplasma sp.]|nr:Fic family protein [Acholeplasma sp.]